MKESYDIHLHNLRQAQRYEKHASMFENVADFIS